MTVDLERIVAKGLSIEKNRVTTVLKLLGEGCTVPFIARYRKEMTGSMDEVMIGQIKDQYHGICELQKRKEFILNVIKESGGLTAALESRILETWDSAVLEDIYLPYKPKRQTRATKARELGLEPLARELFLQKHDTIDHIVRSFVKDQVSTADEALNGAKDIIAEWIAEDERARSAVRTVFERASMISSKVVKSKMNQAAKYEDYFDFSEPLKKCPSHRLLAIFRAESEGLLRVSVQPDPENIIERLKRSHIKGTNQSSRIVAEAIEDAYKRLLSPAIETEFRKKAKEKADKEAIDVFAGNLKQLLLAAPLGEKSVLAIDPGFRTGCKMVCLDSNGELINHSTIYPNAPQYEIDRSRDVVLIWVKKYNVEAVGIGNGTAGRETYDFITSALEAYPLPVYMVNESGASIYSASDLAREEFPDLDLTVRGAISIGRRLMDPLAELVKLDPKSIGVGQYQHDVNATMLKESLETTVGHCVNSVGININTASASLLTHVSGLGPVLAQNIVKYRQENGPFKSRSELMSVPRMGAKSFEQSAGFLRIRRGINPLDNTAVHPERYALVKKMAKDKGVSVEDMISIDQIRNNIHFADYMTSDIGLPTLKDIMNELAKPGLDPRGSAEPVEFHKSIKSIEDLTVGMKLPGVVTNITNFGAFVDIGIKADGLVHISQICNRFIKNPAEVVMLGQKVHVEVIDLDIKRSRVNLSMKGLN